MRTTENLADPIRKLIGSKQPLWLDDLALRVYPLGLYGVQPRTLLRKKATHDPHSASALLDSAVVSSEPASDLFGDVPARVVPDEKQHFLARRLKLPATPRKELRGYGTHRPTVHEPQPRLVKLGQVESVAGDGLGLRVVFGNRPLDKALGLSFLSPELLRVGKATLLHQHSSSKPAVHSGSASATSISRSRRLFFFRIEDRDS